MAEIIQKYRDAIRTEIKKVIVGQDEVIDMIILAYLAEGHVILEGVPGIAKTILARTFARVIGGSFNRIQFTPDLMPSDITGTNIFDIGKSKFIFMKGPVFTNILLADEINRTSPKTQAALLETMQEKQVTVDGERYPLPPPFMVMATQNPIEFEGTYPLPEAQLDRFLMKIVIDYPRRDSEMEVLKKFRDGFDSNTIEEITFKPVKTSFHKDCRKEFSAIRVDENIIEYIQNVIEATRSHRSLILGVSTRAAIHLMNTARFTAAFDGRDYVIPDDVKRVALPVLRHRILLQADAEIEGMKPDTIIEEILDSEKVPR
ncbi:MAG TPA: MoxR family ATPase [Spirochaetota bacterium]|nr:MoxR family ATPase [Spirochaetota bacterium]HPQ52070.1 MoxR family ATPase [Spirochaetota bacterium]